MKITRTARAATVIAAAMVAFTSPAIAHADPAPAPAPTGDAKPAPAPPMLVPVAPKGNGFIDTAAFPLPDAKWLPVDRAQRQSPYLAVIERCSPAKGPTTLPGIEQMPTQMIGHTVVAPGDPAKTGGWAIEVSAARYNGPDAAQKALASLKTYIDGCETLRDGNVPLNAGGIVRNDPTMGNAVFVTAGQVVVEFVVATESGLIEMTMTHPVVPDIEINFNTRAIIAALRGANIDVLVPIAATQPQR